MERGAFKEGCIMLSQLRTWIAERAVEAQQTKFERRMSLSAILRLIGGTGATGLS